VSLKAKIFLFFLLYGLGLKAQYFSYQYIDPCTKEVKTINADMSSPIIIVYYGQVKSFTFEEIQNGTFENWMGQTYGKYQSSSPCQGAVITTTTTSNSNQVYSVINSVMSITSIDFSSLASAGTSMPGVGTSVGQTTSSGSSGIGSKKNKSEKDGKKETGDKDGGESPNSGSGEDQSGSGGSGESGGSSGSSSGSGSIGGSGSSGGSGSNGQEKTEEKTEVISDEAEQGSLTGQNVGSSTSKARTEVQKPAILLTGDIVGVQTVQNGAQDARGTMSFTRVKGDGTSSLGLSADYMINARIGNISAVRSWISTNEKGHKSINLVNGGLNYLPRSWSATAMFIRVNSLKKFTAIYGVAGSYGSLFEEEIISTMAIVGFMYKGRLTKNLDATVIAAGIYSPYSKYYTESLFESSPVVIPFLNLNYRITKTFGFGLTGGGTYIAGQDAINYQLLMGAKLIL
jgi:hypothetical protein